jgi:hypothetical protein
LFRELAALVLPGTYATGDFRQSSSVFVQNNIIFLPNVSNQSLLTTTCALHDKKLEISEENIT